MKWAPAAQLAFIVAASFGVFSFARAARNDHQLNTCQALCHLSPTYANQNRTIPDFELPDWDGNTVRFSSYLGDKPVVLNLWTKTCPPCLEEMPMLAEFAQIVKKDGIRVVTICTDDGPDDVRDTLSVVLQGREPPFDILFDPDTKVVHDMLGTTLYPETWFLDAEGRVRARVDGPRDWSNPIALEVVEMLSRPASCGVDFWFGRPVGANAGLCGEPDLNCGEVVQALIQLESKRGVEARAKSEAARDMASRCHLRKLLDTRREAVLCAMRAASLADYEACAGIDQLLRQLTG
jgi:thiol-disulfide isomerase/thioredoxin